MYARPPSSSRSCSRSRFLVQRYDEALERLPAVWETYLADGWLQLAAVTLRRVFDSAWEAGKVNASPCVGGAAVLRFACASVLCPLFGCARTSIYTPEQL